MKHTRFLATCIGFGMAILVLGISLASSVPSVYSTGDQFKTNDKQFYFSGEILPDHLLYPAVMAADKVKFEMSSPIEKIYAGTTYANLRLESALKLLEKENCPLALTTLTKSQKYLLMAAQMTLELDASEKTREHVLKTLEWHLSKHQEIKEKFSEGEKNIIDNLDGESRIFVEKLK
jgi:hypothetical protein